MFSLVKDLVAVAAWKQKEAVEERNAAALIDLKIRQSEASLASAKNTLAALIVRQRAETRTSEALTRQIADMEARAVAALQAGSETLAGRAAEHIAEMENELAMRRKQLAAIEERVLRITTSVEKANRRLAGLRQGAMLAKSAIAEREAQKRIGRSIGATTSFREAEELIARFTKDRDPFEEAEVLDEIDNSLGHGATRDELAAAGFGDPLKTSAPQVLDRLAQKAGK